MWGERERERERARVSLPLCGLRGIISLGSHLPCQVWSLVPSSTKFSLFIHRLRQSLVRGHPYMTSSLEEGEGGHEKADKCR